MSNSLNPIKLGAISVLGICGIGIISSFVINENHTVPLAEEVLVEQTQPKQLQETSSAQTTSPQLLPGVEKTEEGFKFDDEMKMKLQKISEAYDAQAQYPSFSTPINPDELASKYLPDIPIANELPAKLTDPNSPTLSIKPNQLRFFYGDHLVVDAEISGLSEDENSAVSARLVSNGETLAHATVIAKEDGAHQYQLDFSELRFDDVEWKRELTIDTEFQFLGETYQRGTSIEYLATVAQVEQVAPSEIHDEYLHIPVYISTEKPGYHRLRANLYESETGRPLVNLRAEEQVDGRSGVLILKAHIAALKEAGSEGPYELKDISLQRLPSKPDFITEFGRVDQDAYDVEGYNFSEYLDKPYVNEKAQRIANELRRLGS